jgi:hypothetical protein
VSWGTTLPQLQNKGLPFRAELNPVEHCPQSQAANRTIRADIAHRSLDRLEESSEGNASRN